MLRPARVFFFHINSLNSFSLPGYYFKPLSISFLFSTVFLFIDIRQRHRSVHATKGQSLYK